MPKKHSANKNSDPFLMGVKLSHGSVIARKFQREWRSGKHTSEVTALATVMHRKS